MKCSYRGIPYESTTAFLEATESGITGKYRGIEMKINAPVAAPVPNAFVRLRYRGVDYLKAR